MNYIDKKLEEFDEKWFKYDSDIRQDYGFTMKEIRDFLKQALEEQREGIVNKLETMQLEGLSFTEVQKDAYNTAISDVIRFINLKK